MMLTGRKWTIEEHEYLMQNYAVISVEELAVKLNRTIKSIKSYAGKNGFRKNYRPAVHVKIAAERTAREEQILKMAFFTALDTAERINQRRKEKVKLDLDEFCQAVKVYAEIIMIGS